MKRNPQGGVHAYVIDQGRAWIESINTLTNTALVRFDANEGIRSRVHKVELSKVDFNREWKF